MKTTIARVAARALQGQGVYQIARGLFAVSALQNFYPLRAACGGHTH